MTLEVGQFRKGANDKWRFVKLGYAKKNDKGQLNVYFDALPLPDEKGCSIVIQERKEQYQSGDPAGTVTSGSTSGASLGIDDEIPF